MKAITVEPGKPGRARLEEVPEPDPREGSVLVEAIAVGVCGTVGRLHTELPHTRLDLTFMVALLLALLGLLMFGSVVLNAGPLG